MALPKLNVTNTYRLTVPSTGEEVTYRPYLVKEEKQMMIANETGDQQQMMEVMAKTIDACVESNTNVKSLTTFDVEYMFTQIRGRSVGETSDISISCNDEECGHKTEVTINVMNAKVEMTDNQSLIELSEDISVEMKYPAYGEVVNNYKQGDDESVEFGFTMLAKSIAAVMTEDERIIIKDLPVKEVKDFIDAMTRQQFEKLGEFLNHIPALGLDVEWTCEKCGKENEHNLKGLQDFFS